MVETLWFTRFLTFLTIVTLFFSAFVETPVSGRVIEYFAPGVANISIRNRWRRLCLAFVYLLGGLFIILLCYFYENKIVSFPFASKLEPRFSRLLFWCLGWSFVGFSGIASQTVRLDSGQNDPFPSYIYFYPSFLIVNSLLVFGLVGLFNRINIYSTYALAAYFCFSLGFWIDSSHFRDLLAVLEKIIGKLFKSS